MLLNLPVHGVTLVDKHGLPRFWATVWTLLELAALAASTRKERLTHLEAFYLHTEQTHGHGQLEDAVSTIDLDTLGEMLEGFFLSLKNQPVQSLYAEARWRTATSFVRAVCQRLGRAATGRHRLKEIELRLARLERLYAPLRVTRRMATRRLRSLPSSVLHELYEIAAPESAANPFCDEATRLRMWLCFVLLLHQGFRRGEFLALPGEQRR
jgi:hypothetical protein